MAFGPSLVRLPSSLLVVQSRQRTLITCLTRVATMFSRRSRSSALRHRSLTVLNGVAIATMAGQYRNIVGLNPSLPVLAGAVMTAA
jgi:hypothetical protein